MINLLIGPPGGGKSYEAVVFHILPALKSGRKVITNLPVNVEMFRALDHRYADLLEVRTVSLDGSSRPFSVIADYGDPWRHPDPKNACGPLYVIDEAHECLPAGGFRTPGIPKEVGEWFATHRHEFADVLIITQAHGNVAKEVTSRIQLVYRVKKAVALGRMASYIRKVQDGLRGEVVDFQERPYEKQYFSLYTSHTRAITKGNEAAASDVSPRFIIFKRAGYAVILLGLLLVGYTGCSSASKVSKKNQEAAARMAQGRAAAEGPRAPSREVPTPASAVAIASAPQLAASVPESQNHAQPVSHPFQGLGIHVAGSIRSESRQLYQFALSQNGQAISYITGDDLREAGYSLDVVSDCVAKIKYQDQTPFFARCDLPQISAPIAGTSHATGVTPPAAGDS